MEIDNTYLKEQLHDARRYLDLECERLQERIDTMNAYQKMMEQYEAVLEENERLKSELEEQQAEIDSLHQQLDAKELKLNELGKFSVNVAKKSLLRRSWRCQMTSWICLTIWTMSSLRVPR